MACFMLECVSCTARVTLSHESLFATIHADAIIPLPRAPFARLFTAFACECARGPVRERGYTRVLASTCPRIRYLVRVFARAPLHWEALRETHERISKCTGSRNNAKSHGCVYIVEREHDRG